MTFINIVSLLGHLGEYYSDLPCYMQSSYCSIVQVLCVCFVILIMCVTRIFIKALYYDYNVVYTCKLIILM